MVGTVTELAEHSAGSEPDAHFLKLEQSFRRLLPRLTRSGVQPIASEVHPPVVEDCGCSTPAFGTVAFSSPEDLVRASIVALIELKARVILNAEAREGNYWLIVDLNDLDSTALYEGIQEKRDLGDKLYSEVYSINPPESHVAACTEVEDEEQTFAHHPSIMASRGFEVDVAIAPLLEVLWAQGIETVCSCGGDADFMPTVSIEGLIGSLRAFEVAVEVTGAEYVGLEYRSDGGHNPDGEAEYDLILNSAKLKHD